MSNDDVSIANKGGYSLRVDSMAGHMFRCNPRQGNHFCRYGATWLTKRAKLVDDMADNTVIRIGEF